MKRFPLPDLLKGLAAFFMVQIHITELFIDPAGKESIWGKISLFMGGPFAAVVFMTVMGYFIALNKQKAHVNVLRGIKIFMLGFLLNIGLNFHLLLKIYIAGWQYDPYQYIFGADILYLAGLSIVILSLIRLFKKWQSLAAMALFLAVVALTGILNEKLTLSAHYYLLPMVAGKYSWSYFPLFPWLAYPLAGFIFAHFQDRLLSFFEKQKKTSFILIGIIGFLVVIFAIWGIGITINLPNYYHHTFGYIFWALGLTILWTLFIYILLKSLPDTYVGNLFCEIGRNITAFYVIQWLIIGNLATYLFHTQRIGTFPFWAGSIFLITVLLTFLYEKLQKAPFVRKAGRKSSQ